MSINISKPGITKGHDEFVLGEQILDDAFADAGISTDKKTEYSRICLLNQIYSTELSNKAIFAIAGFWVRKRKKLNAGLQKGDPGVVESITKCIKKNKKLELTGDNQYCYSFATKYCSFAVEKKQKNNYPIFDSYTSMVYRTRREI